MDIEQIFKCSAKTNPGYSTVDFVTSGDPIFIIDDVYDDPDSVREFVSKLPYDNKSIPDHPGICHKAAAYANPVAGLVSHLLFNSYGLKTGSFFAQLGQSRTWKPSKVVPHTDNAAD